jgi:hypothetical protein
MTYKEAQQIADRLIQNFIGPDYRVMCCIRAKGHGRLMTAISCM